MKIPLKQPITVAREQVVNGKQETVTVTYTECDVDDEPSVGDVEVFENAQQSGKSEMTATILMLANHTGLPEDVVRKFKASDLTKVTETWAPFLEDTAPKPEPPTQE